MSKFKDADLTRLVAEGNNVARFVGIAPTGELRHAAIAEGRSFEDAGQAVAALLDACGQVNVRSYHPDRPESHPFVYGLTDLDEVTATIADLTGRGLYVLVNETINVNDGGVSGVCFGGRFVEFAPGDTPRCVEKPGTARLSLGDFHLLCEVVYNMNPDLFDTDDRVEFSVHPAPVGYLQSRTIIWEVSPLPPGSAPDGEVVPAWPNRFSQMVGDKTFGLFVASALLGQRVPYTTAICRDTAPFSFGEVVEGAQVWLRTAPRSQTPGLYSTTRTWTDPMVLLATEDPDHDKIAAVLAQHGIEAAFSGAAVAGSDGELIIEGKPGYGDDFMVGADVSELPELVVVAVRQQYESLSARLGPCRFEWVVDDRGLAWVVQLHRGESASAGDVIYPGSPGAWHEYRTDDGIDGLRELISVVSGTGEGIRLVGNVGITSHLGDILRKAQVPSVMVRP